MEDAAPPAQTAPKAPKERSPSFPFIPLQTAIRRLEEFEKHFGRHPTPANHAGAAWGMKPASSKAAQTLAALKSFGFAEYEGAGVGRLTRLTDLARMFLRAQQDSVKQEAIRTAAMRPKAIQAFFKQWGADRPTDPVCLDELVLKHGYTDAAARLFLKVYDQTITFAGFADSDVGGIADSGMGGIADPADDDTGEQDDQDTSTPPKPIKAGDMVQREFGGELKFPAPRKVTSVFFDRVAGWMVSVDGYSGAYPMTEIQPVKATPSVTPPVMMPVAAATPIAAEDAGKGQDPIETFLANGRLQINANVGVDGIARLRQMLEKYEELMRLMI